MEVMDTQEHWERVYDAREPDQVSWFLPHLLMSLELIERAAPDRSALIIDVGAGTSTLVDDLLAAGYPNLTVLGHKRPSRPAQLFPPSAGMIDREASPDIGDDCTRVESKDIVHLRIELIKLDRCDRLGA
jgi:hypothetical protein